MSFRGKSLSLGGLDRATHLSALKVKLEELTTVPVANQKLVRADLSNGFAFFGLRFVSVKHVNFKSDKIKKKRCRRQTCRVSAGRDNSPSVLLCTVLSLCAVWTLFGLHSWPNSVLCRRVEGMIFALLLFHAEANS